MKPFQVMPIIFNIVKYFVVFSIVKRYYTIEKIEEIKSTKEFLISFFSARERHFFAKSPIEIMQNPKLIMCFKPVDAATIGMYTAQAHYNKLKQNTF